LRRILPRIEQRIIQVKRFTTKARDDEKVLRTALHYLLMALLVYFLE